MKRISSILLFLWLGVLVIIANSGCSNQKQSKDFILEEDLTIGVEYGDERYMFAEIGTIALDAEENIYTFDGKDYRIQKFDKNGNFLKSLEIEKGVGPAEVTYITGLSVTEKGKIFAYDRNSTKILIFDKEGQFLHSFKLGFRAMNILPHSEENVMVFGLREENIFHVFNQEGELLQSFGEPFEIPSQYSKYENFPFMKLPGSAYRSRTGKIFIVNPHKYEVRVYEENEIKGVIKHRSDFFSPATVRENPDGRITFRFPGAFVVEDRNRLYVTLEGSDQDAGYQLDVFENKKYVTSLKVKGLAFAIDKQGRLYFSEEEEFPKMVRYKVEQKQ